MQSESPRAHDEATSAPLDCSLPLLWPFSRLTPLRLLERMLLFLRRQAWSATRSLQNIWKEVIKRGTRPPRYCPTCNQDLSRYPYYQLRPSPFARQLLALARLLIPVMSVLFLIHLSLESFPTNFHGALGHYIMAYVGGPSLLIYTLTLPIPRIRRVICLHCSWYRDYPFRWGRFEARSGEAQPPPDALSSA